MPKWHPGVDATNPDASLKYAANWMAQLIHKYGSPAAALSVYNSGNPSAYKNPGFAGGQTYNYVKSILAKAGQQAAGPAGAVSPPAQPTRQLQAATPTQRFKTTDLLPLLKILGLGDIPGISELAQIRTPLQQQRLPGQRVVPGKPITPQVQIQGKVTASDVAVVKLAKQFIGTPYVWGGASPKQGFDCSGLLQYVWAQRGVNIPRVTYDQVKAGVAIDRSQLRPGDAVFFHSGPRGPEHVGMWVGNGKFVESPHTGATIRISRLAGRTDFVAARRYG